MGQAENSPEFPKPAAHEPARVGTDLLAVRAAADLVVIQLHWGYEWRMYPLRTLRDWARSYVEAGADLVICHHAHVPMGVERWGNGLIAHGLGNLYFGPGTRQTHPFRSRSVVLQVSVAQRSVIEARVVPIHTTDVGRLEASTGPTREITLRGIGYLSRRLDRDRYLDRIEHQVVATQGSLLIKDLADRLARGDSSGALERGRYLSRPRQRWLIGQLIQRDSFLADIGHTLDRIRQAPDERTLSILRDRIAALGGRAERGLARTVALGRLP